MKGVLNFDSNVASLGKTISKKLHNLKRIMNHLSLKKLKNLKNVSVFKKDKTLAIVNYEMRQYIYYSALVTIFVIHVNHLDLNFQLIYFLVSFNL